MVARIARLWCFLRGHDMVEEAHIDNGRSRFGDKVCLRCGHRHSWQYDYCRY